MEQLVKQIGETDAEAVVMLGNLAPRGMPHDYGQLFKTLA